MINRRWMTAAVACVCMTLGMTGCGSKPASNDAATGQETATEAASEPVDAEDDTEEEPYEEDFGEALTTDKDGRVSNGFISIKMPSELEGTYLAYSYDNDINIYDKASNEAGFGGFCFGVAVTDSFDEYGGMRTKIGQLTDANGKLYHVLLSYPSDVQWDFTKSDEMPASYKALYDRGREIASTLEPVGGGEYVDGGGTKGEEIYGDLLKDIIKKIQSAKDSDELEAEELSPVYYAMTQGANPKDPMTDIGVAYVDFNLDGVDEMVMGDMENGQIYDIFASIDGKPAHVVSGHWRDYYKIYGSVLAEYPPEEIDVQVIATYDLLPNSTELFGQYSIKLDETEGAADKWSVSYDDQTTWEPITEEDYKMYLSNIEDLGSDKPVEFKALGEYK